MNKLSIFDDFLSPFDWDKDFYKFNREEKDTHPYSFITNPDNSMTIVHNVLGLDKKDIKLVVKEVNDKGYILISGETKDEITNKVYSINSKFDFSPRDYNLDNVTSTMKNGLLYITIGGKKEKPTSKENIIKIS